MAITLGKVRFNYPALTSPTGYQDSAPKYGIQIIVDKNAPAPNYVRLDNGDIIPKKAAPRNAKVTPVTQVEVLESAVMDAIQYAEDSKSIDKELAKMLRENWSNADDLAAATIRKVKGGAKTTIKDSEQVAELAEKDGYQNTLSFSARRMPDAKKPNDNGPQVGQVIGGKVTPVSKEEAESIVTSGDYGFVTFNPYVSTKFCTALAFWLDVVIKTADGEPLTAAPTLNSTASDLEDYLEMEADDILGDVTEDDDNDSVF